MTEFSKEEAPTKPDAPQALEVSGRNWSAKVPTALLVTILTVVLGGGMGVTNRIESRLDRIEAKLERASERQARRELELERRLVMLEGAHGRPSQ